MLGGSWGSKNSKRGRWDFRGIANQLIQETRHILLPKQDHKGKWGRAYGQLFLLRVCGKAPVGKTWNKEKDIEQSWIWSKKEQGLAKNHHNPWVCLSLHLTSMPLRVTMLITSIFQGFHQFLFWPILTQVSSKKKGILGNVLAYPVFLCMILS